MKHILAFLITWCSIYPMCAQQTDPLRVVEHKLSNGMTVWLNEDHSQPKVMGAVVVKAGANDCPNTGIAHYFEHIMFKGTDQIGTTNYQAEKPWLDSISARYDQLALTADKAARRALQQDINRLSRKAADYSIPNEFNSLITRYGGSKLNAYTSYDETVYHNEFAPQYIAQWAELNSERLIHPVFRGFQNELETVYEEKNMVNDNVLGNAMEKFMSKLFAGSPYAYPVLGSTENLKNPKLSEMREFFDKYYVAGNMGLILCGDIDPSTLMPLLERTFGRIRPGNAPTRAPWQLSPFTGKETLGVKLPIPLIKIDAVAFRAPTDDAPDAPALDIATQLLSNDNNTGLLDSLVHSHKMLYAFCERMALRHTGLLFFGAVPNIPFGSKHKVETLCRQQVDRLKSGAFSDEMLQSLKRDYIREKQQMMEQIDSRASAMIDAFTQDRSWDDYISTGRNVANLTKADIMRVATRYFNDQSIRVVKKYGSGKKDKMAQPGYQPVTPKNIGAQSAYAEQLSKVPTDDKPVRLIDFDRDATTIALSPQVNLYAVKNPVNDLFKLQFIFHQGTIADPLLEATKEYLSTVGTDSLSKLALGKAFQQLGSHMAISVDNASFILGISGYDRNLAPTLRLLNHFMHHAEVDARKMRDVVTERKLSDRTFFKDNTTIANAVFERVANGDHSAYLTQPSAKTLSALRAEDLLAHFADVQRYACSIVYSGQLPPDEVVQALKQQFPIDSMARPARSTFVPLMPVSEPTVYLFNNPSARQTIIGTYAQLPPAPTVEDRVRQTLWADYLGNGMSSVIFQEIREFRSLAYYASANLMCPSLIRHADAPTAFTTRLGTQADKTMNALSVLDSLLTHMPLRQTGVDIARQGILNRISNNFPSFRNIGNRIAFLHRNGYTEDPSRRWLTILPSLSANDVTNYQTNTAGKEPRAILVVGNKKKLDLKRLAQYGRIVELYRSDIYR